MLPRGNHLLQIDGEAGAVLNSFFLGTNVTHLSLGAQNDIWVCVQGEQALRRFNLETLTSEPKIVVTSPGRTFTDLFASQSDPTLVIACLDVIAGDWPRVFAIVCPFRRLCLSFRAGIRW